MITIDDKLKVLSSVVNRSLGQTKILYELCDSDFNKLLFIEQKIKENFLNYTPARKESIDRILSMTPKDFPWKDIFKEYNLELLKYEKKLGV